MKTIEQYEAECQAAIMATQSWVYESPPPDETYPTGIECPDCKSELRRNQLVYGYGPFSYGVQCKCGLNGMICSFRGKFTRLDTPAKE
jgi:hypothetical protein